MLILEALHHHTEGRSLPVVASRMVTGMDPAGLSMPPLPHMSTPPRMSTPGASSHVPGHLGFSPAATTPR
eukprot:847433-Prorocentrum_lima.AAC.1